MDKMTTDRLVWLFGFKVPFFIKRKSRGSCTSVSGQKKGLSYYRSTAERKFKISLRNNFTSPNQNRWFRQKNLLNKLYAVFCDRNEDWWQWSSQRLSSLGYFRFKNILSAFIVHDPARVCNHEDSPSENSPHLLKRSDHYRFSLLAGWIY